MSTYCNFYIETVGAVDHAPCVKKHHFGGPKRTIGGPQTPGPCPALPLVHCPRTMDCQTPPKPLVSAKTSPGVHARTYKWTTLRFWMTPKSILGPPKTIKNHDFGSKTGVRDPLTPIDPPGTLVKDQAEGVLEGGNPWDHPRDPRNLPKTSQNHQKTTIFSKKQVSKTMKNT